MTSYDERRQKQREETENRILETAIKLFGENGYAKTTIKEIAEEADVAVGLVGKYFPTKEVLLSEAYIHTTRSSYAPLEKNNSARDSVQMLVRCTVEVFKNKPEYYKFFKTMMNASDLPQEYIDARREFFCNSSVFPHIVSEQEKETIYNKNAHDYFISFMKMIFNLIEIYDHMPHEGENNVAHKSIELVMKTIEECL